MPSAPHPRERDAIRTERHRQVRASLVDINARFAEHFVLMDEVLDFAEDLLSGGSIRGSRPRGLNIGVVYLVASFLAKACKTARAIRAVTRAGCGQDASVLLRGLFETTLAVLYVLQRSSKKRAAMIAANADQRRLVMVEAVRRTRGSKRVFSRDDLRRAQEKVNAWSRLLTASELAGARKHWAGSTGIEGVAKALRRGGWERAYNTIYRYTSAFSHGSDVDAHFFVSPMTGAPVVKLLPGSDELSRVTVQSCFFLLVICARMNERIGLGLDVQQLDELHRRVVSLGNAPVHGTGS